MDRQAAGSPDPEWTTADTVRLVVVLVVLLMTGGTFILACQNDSKRAEQRKECESKGGVWYIDGRVCLDIRTIPIKE